MRESMRDNRDWGAVIDRLNATKSGAITVKMGSPGSAQVTRCRLLREYRNLNATTVGSKLKLSIAA